MIKKTIKINNKNFGSDLFLISGPCVIENDYINLTVAEKLKNISDKLNIEIIYKSSFMKDNRSSIDYYMGPGIYEGLKILEKIKKEFNMLILSDVHYIEHIKPASEILDIIQIPAYLSMQTTLVVEAAKTGKPINLKHSQFVSPDNMINPVKKIESTGNKNIMITERGYTFGYNDLIVDPRSFYYLNKIGYPVIFDITHSIRKYGIPSSDPNGGMRNVLPTISRAGIAAGVDGIFIETHPKPCDALCDASSQIDINDLEEFLKPLIEIHYIEKKYRK